MAGTNKNICEMKDMKWFLAILVGIFCPVVHEQFLLQQTAEYMKHALSDMSPMEVEGMKTNERAATVEKNACENPTRCMNSNWCLQTYFPNDNVVSTDGFEFAPKVDMQNMNFLNSESVMEWTPKPVAYATRTFSYVRASLIPRQRLACG